MEHTDIQRKIVQLEMDKFATEKHLTGLKQRVIERELSWPEYKAFKSQLLTGKSERQYFSDINLQRESLKKYLSYKNNGRPHKKAFFFAGVFAFFISALLLSWHLSFTAPSAFVVKEPLQPKLFLDKQVYELGEPVFIRIIPSNTPYLLSVIYEDTQTALLEPVFAPEQTGTYQIVGWLETKSKLEKVSLEFTVVSYKAQQ